ncbi:J domain-containing protein [Sphingomonas sp.]
MAKLLLAAAIVALIWWLVAGQKRAPKMSDKEAREVLGVARDATADDVRAAHRRLLGAVHPDKGGSADLTRRINAARDVLMKRLR